MNPRGTLCLNIRTCLYATVSGNVKMGSRNIFVFGVMGRGRRFRLLWKMKSPLISSPKPFFLLVYEQKPWVLNHWGPDSLLRSLPAASFHGSVSLKTPLERHCLMVISCRSTLLDSCLTWSTWHLFLLVTQLASFYQERNRSPSDCDATHFMSQFVAFLSSMEIKPGHLVYKFIMS